MIGGYNVTKFAKKDHDITWNALQNKNYWTMKLVSVKLCNHTVGDEQDIDLVQRKRKIDLQTKSTVAILDSGTSYLLMPIEDHTNFLEILRNNYNLYF